MELNLAAIDQPGLKGRAVPSACGLTGNSAHAMATPALLLVLAAADISDAWRDQLARQLLGDHNCVLNYMTGIQRFELLGRKTVKLRAHCIDGRAYDVTRADLSVRFEIEACGNVEC